nr:uncharacterized protein LOC113818580 [Penaeus vannamei]
MSHKYVSNKAVLKDKGFLSKLGSTLMGRSNPDPFVDVKVQSSITWRKTSDVKARIKTATGTIPVYDDLGEEEMAVLQAEALAAAGGSAPSFSGPAAVAVQTAALAAGFGRTMSGEQYRMVLLGQRRPSAPQGLLYTSLLPSSGPTKLSYNMDTNDDDSLSRYCSRATNIVWSDLDGAPLTTHRKASRALPTDLDEVETESSHKPRRASRAHTTNLADLDPVPFAYRRATREEKKEYGESYAVMPYEPIVIEETLDTKPICRSDTVANLLDKYSNFSTKREFGYRGPTSAWARHLGETHAFVSTIPDTDDSMDDSRRTHSRTGPPVSAENDLAGLSRSREHSRSRTPRPLDGRGLSHLIQR